MLKPLLVLFNLISFIVISALLPADIKIDTKLPDGGQFVKDSSYVIEVSIEKGAVFGFAKFQLSIPEGYMAQPIETSDASFTFADGKIKFIWMAIPEADVVKVSYSLTAGSDAPAQGMLEGTFSYIEENERKKYDLPAIPISAVSPQEGEGAVASVRAEAEASRKVVDLGDGNYEVRLSINKKGVEGFAKIEEFLPEGTEATVVENNKAVFSQVDDRAKFVWMSVPAGEQVNVSYKVSGAAGIGTALDGMEGSFSFLDNNDTRTVAIMGAGDVDASALASNESSQQPASDQPQQPLSPADEIRRKIAEAKANQPVETITTGTSTVPEEPLEDVAVVEEVKVEEPVKPAPKPVTEVAVKPTPKPKKEEPPLMASKANVPNPETGVTYKVQVVAGHKVVSEKYIKEHFKFDETVSMENHEGWVKYTTGSFDMYKGARDKRETINQGGHNFPGPFVTAYNAGERITVQEALMITNQKWYK
ncbi:MAG: hypothetical protein R2813_09210 [Flavobacteriales bacterium]